MSTTMRGMDRATARDAQMVELARRGLSLRDIGREVGVTGECVRLRLNALGFGPKERAAAKKRVRRHREAVSEATRAAAAEAHARRNRCAVCRAGLPLGRRVTCSHRCATIWPQVRFYTQEGHERHRQAIAKSVIANPAAYSPALVRRAQRYLEDPASVPQTRSWTVRGSRASRLARAYGFIDGRLERAATTEGATR